MRPGWIVVLALLCCAPFTAEASRARIDQLVKDAQRHYQAGRYLESAEASKQAFALQPNAQHLYNIARAYDQANELDQALDYYQRYIDSPGGTDPTLLKRAALSMDRLRGLVAQRDEAQKREAEEQARLAQKAQAERERADQEAEAKARAEQALEAQQQAAAEARARARARNRTLALVAGGVAVAGLGTGTGFGLSARSARSAFDGADTVAQKQTFEDQTRFRSRVADASFGVGVVAAVVAVLLYPRSEAEPGTSVDVGPGGASVQVRF
jgi:tetratricopeptide (TPR) repeat protein